MTRLLCKSSHHLGRGAQHCYCYPVHLCFCRSPERRHSNCLLLQPNLCRSHQKLQYGLDHCNASSQQWWSRQG